MRYLALFLVLCGWCAGAVKPVIVSNDLFRRSAYTLPKYYIYIPADKNGEYWTRYTYEQANSSNAAKTTESYCIRAVHYGKCYAGKQQMFSAAGADLTPATQVGAGEWADDAAVFTTTWGTVKVAGNTEACSFPIPDTHDRLHVIVAVTTGLTGRSFTLSVDGDDIDATSLGSINLADVQTAYGLSGLIEVPITTAMPDSANKVLTITAAGGNCFMAGIRTYDTGTPSINPGTLDVSSSDIKDTTLTLRVDLGTGTDFTLISETTGR
jgi:hypothetical protein